MEKLLKKKRKAQADNNKLLLTSVCIDLAEKYLSKGDYRRAIEEYKIVARIYSEQNNVMDYACANRMIGEAYTHLQMYDEALEHEQIYLKIAHEEGNRMEEQRAFATIGHIYLTMSLCAESPNIEHLNEASEHFANSLKICEKLIGISKIEQMDMMARLLANLGIVSEAQGNLAKGIELVTKSIHICQKYDIYEQLERCYTSLSSLYAKSGDYSSAISNLNLSLNVASRLTNKVALTCATLLTKGEILVRMGDLQGAKQVFHKAYKLKSPVQSDYVLIERNLKVVAAMSSAEESLLVTSQTDHHARKVLYEKLGDGLCHFKEYRGAVEYYKKMLECAKEHGDCNKMLSPCYVSLAQTYQDDKQYDKAIEYYKLDLQLSKDNLRESINTTFNIIHAMHLAQKGIDEVLRVFMEAQDICRQANSNKQLARVIERQILYLKSNLRLSEAAKLEPQLDALECPISESESEVEDAIGLGDDVDIENITDLLSSDDEKDLTLRTARKLTKGIPIKRNMKGETQLHVAAINGNAALVSRLLEQGHAVNIRDHAGWLPIHEACITGHLDIVKMLIDKGAAINDRGGTMCNGITPLHDAASNGHLDVIEYMLSKGASPLAKCDNGETPLHILKNWRENASLDEFEKEAYDSLVAAMTTALEKAGQTSASLNITRNNDALVLIDSDDSSQSFTRSRTVCKDRHVSDKQTKCSKPAIVSDLRRTIHAGDYDDGDEDDDDYLCTQQSEAATDYQNTINSLRNSSIAETKKRKSLALTTKLSAHLSFDEVHVDNWLEDDLPTMKKKRRLSSVDLYEISSNDSKEIDNSEPICVESYSHSRKARKTQTTLLKSGFTRTRGSPSPIEWQSIDNESHISPPPVQSIPDMNSTQNIIKNQMLFVDVRIKERLFRIPFPAKELEALTIHWLAKETAQRVYKKESMIPVIEMETKNGALLSDNDLLSVLFPLGATQCEELRAKVLKWDVPALKARYLDACQHFNTEPDDAICNVLELSTTSLSLIEKNYRVKLLPVCRSLNHQTNLCELNLKGNLTGGKLMEELCVSLPTLNNLSVLILSTNQLNCDSLRILATTVSQYSCLSKLKCLDLSFNPLGNECAQYLAALTQSLVLEKLNLSAVDLSSGVFDENCNCQLTMKLTMLQDLNLSYNKLGKRALSKFLEFVSADQIQVLHVGNNAIESNGFGHDLALALRKHDKFRINLRELNLSRCKLDDDDVFELQMALFEANQLDELNLSHNCFKGSTLKRLLISTTPKRLIVIGCEELRSECEAYNESDWRFAETSSYSCESFSCSLDSIHNAKQCEILIKMFKDKYREAVKVDGICEGLLNISI